MKKFSKKITAILGTTTLAIGLMALPALAGTTQGQGSGWVSQMQNYMQQSFNTHYGYGMMGGYGGVNGNSRYGMMGGYSGSNSNGSYGMMGGYGEVNGNGGYGMMGGYSGSNGNSGTGMMGAW